MYFVVEVRRRGSCCSWIASSFAWGTAVAPRRPRPVARVVSPQPWHRRPRGRDGRSVTSSSCSSFSSYSSWSSPVRRALVHQLHLLPATQRHCPSSSCASSFSSSPSFSIHPLGWTDAIRRRQQVLLLPWHWLAQLLCPQTPGSVTWTGQSLLCCAGPCRCPRIRELVTWTDQWLFCCVGTCRRVELEAGWTIGPSPVVARTVQMLWWVSPAGP